MKLRTIKFNSTPLNIVKKYTYLGIVHSSTSSFKQTLVNSLAKEKSAGEQWSKFYLLKRETIRLLQSDWLIRRTKYNSQRLTQLFYMDQVRRPWTIYEIWNRSKWFFLNFKYNYLSLPLAVFYRDGHDKASKGNRDRSSQIQRQSLKHGNKQLSQNYAGKIIKNLTLTLLHQINGIGSLNWELY